MRRAFTLIELLVVMAIITVLASLLTAAVVRARAGAQIARARADMQAIQTGLSMYQNEYRFAPKHSPREGAPDLLLANDAAALYAALLNQREAGGGAHAPYLKGREAGVGVVLDRAVLQAPTMGQQVEERVRYLEGEELTDRHYAEFQLRHGPRSAQPLVLLDPWGRPYHYREWGSVGRREKEALHRDPPRRGPFAPLPHMGGPAPLTRPVRDQPLDPYGYDLWSSGPNGVNEYGDPDSDDVVVGAVRRP